MGISDADLTRILKVTYEDNPVLDEPLYKLSKFYAMVPKKRGGGLEHDIPYRISESQGLGRDFEATYERVIGNSLGPKFTNQRMDFDEFYGFWDIPINQKLRATRKGADAYVNLMMLNVNSLEHSMSMHRWQQMLKDGSGALAQVAAAGVTDATAAVATTKGSWKIKLAEKVDVRFLLGIGTHIVFAPKANKTSGTIRRHVGGTGGGADATFVIKTLDEIEGTFTVELLEVPGTRTSIAAPAAEDWIFIPGVHRAGGIKAVRTGDGTANITGTTNVMSGLENLWPATPGTWWGLDMSLNPGRLSGARFDRAKLATLTGLGDQDPDIGLTEKNPDRSVLAALGQLSLRGGKFEYAMCNSPQFVKTILGLGSKIRLNRVESKGAEGAYVGFQAVRFHTGDNDCKLMSENAIPDNAYFGFNFKDLCIRILTKKFISLWRHDNKTIDRVQGKNRIYGMSESRAYLQAFNFKNFCRIDTA